MTPDGARVEYAQRMGDNCLILAHRLSEWCGHAPVLEEDIALANVALDLIGQTRLWLDLAGEIEAKGRDADAFAYRRDSAGFRNLLLVELPNGDFARSLVRQSFFDIWHFHTLKGLEASREPRFAEIAAKAIKEVAYHLERSGDLVVRLGDGSEESHARIETAVADLWPYCGELFCGDGIDDALAADNIAPAPAAIEAAWRAGIGELLSRATVALPGDGHMHRGGKQGIHSEHHGFILAEMQFLQRAYPGASW